MGGGTAGITVALDLAKRGIFSTIAEKSPTIGGRVSELCCKGVVECVRCDVCLSNDKIKDLVQSDFIRVLTNTELARVTGKPGAYRATLKRSASFVREDACVTCGACTDACPVEGGAIRCSTRDSAPRTYQVDTRTCSRFKGEDCEICVDVCPVGAIDFSAATSNKQITVSAIIVANGYEPFDPSIEKRFGYGICSDVVSAVEVERSINRTGRILVPSTGMTPKRIAMIQCVGSRDDRFGASYCSKVCCKYALKTGQLLKIQNPEAHISFFFLDWRPNDLIYDELTTWATEGKDIALIRSRPAEIIVGEFGPPILRFASADDEEVREEEFDLVILSVGILPPTDAPELASLLHLKTTEQGFIAVDSELGDVDDNSGIFAAGCCTGPKDITDSVMDGMTTAGKVASFLEVLK